MGVIFLRQRAYGVHIFGKKVEINLNLIFRVVSVI